MQKLSRKIKGLSMVALLSVAMPLFAESAPVYDADTMPPQFESAGDQDSGQDLPPPPPPGQEGAFNASQLPAAHVNNNAMSLEQRLRRAEQQISNMQNNDAVTRLDSLQSQVQSLRGQVEQLTHQLAQVDNQQKTLYTDLDKRLSQPAAAPVQAAPVNQPVAAVNTPPTDMASVRKAQKAKMQAAMVASNAATAVPAASQTQDVPNVAEEQQIYQTAYNLIKAKKYDQAVDTLQGMLKKYPSGQFASNAHYWLGELYGLMGKNDKALVEFDSVVKTYPDSPRISDAQLKVGLIYASQSKWTDAKSAFKKVINRYPGTASAKLAAEHLKEIRQAGK